MPVVVLPRLLRPVVGPETSLDVAGTTVGEVVDALLARHPGLRPHLFDETGRLRPHVLCFVDGRATRLDDVADPVAPGSEVRFLQAVSGGGTAGATPDRR